MPRQQQRFMPGGDVARALMILLVAAGACFGQGPPRVRDAWYQFVEGETRYGFRHVRLEKLPDGNFRYDVVQRMLISVLGASSEDIRSKLQLVVTPGLRPVSVEHNRSRAAGDVVTSGSVENGVLVLETMKGSEKTRAEINLRDDEPCLFECTLEDWLATLPEGTTEARTRILDEDSWKEGSETARKLDSGGAVTRWELDPGKELGRRIVTMAADGTVQQVRFRFPRLHYRICPATEARNISVRVMQGRELLTFPTDKAIGPPHRIEQLSVRLSWKDIPWEAFVLQDTRQRILKRVEEKGRYSALVELRRPAPADDDGAIPVEGAEFEPYLKESHFIKPKHAAIRKAAQAVVGQARSALEAVKALAAFVNGHMDGEMVAETLSGPEVLACKKGKCTEYSTLFASMARSVGVPTRIALGERLVVSSWVGHMWNEAWVGRWVTVDASANEVGESFSLLKFIHSDTVEGTQRLRWLLTESLQISVDSVKLRPSDLAGRYETGIEGRTYTNVDHVCRLTAPDETWTLVDVSYTGQPTVRFKIKDAESVFITFVAFSLPEGTEPGIISAARLRRARDSDESLKVFKNEPRKVAGAGGHTLRFGGVSVKEPLVMYHSTEVIWVRGAHGYLLTFMATEAGHEKHLPGFEKLLASFRFLDQ